MAKRSKTNTIFTKTLLDNARQPKDAPTLVLTESRVPGFQFLVGKNTKTFSYKGYFNNEPFRILIGRYPQFTIDEARAKAFEFDQKVKKGIDPRYVPGENLEAALEFAINWRISEDKLSEKTAREYRRMIKHQCKAWVQAGRTDHGRPKIFLVGSSFCWWPARTESKARARVALA